MNEERPGPSRRQDALHAILRLAALVAAALAVPRVLEHLGVRDVSWAPPDYGLVEWAADPIAPGDAVRAGADGAAPDRDAAPGRLP